MSRKPVWYPDRSYKAPAADSEESGRGSLHASSSEQEQDSSTRGRKKLPIPRRRTPTVIPTIAAAIGKCEVVKPSPKVSYATMAIESRGETTLLELSFSAYEKSKISNPKNDNWFCGWTDHEYLDLHQTSKMASNCSDGFDRTRLHTPAEGYRSSLHSRASSSRYTSSRDGHRVHQYTFHHFKESGDYIENYRDLYSYTSLITGSTHLKGKEAIAFFEGEDDDDATLPIGVRSLYHGDSYLRELVNRLGIKDAPLSFPQEWEREQQQLLQGPRPTPPSIVKKRRSDKATVNIVVSNSAPKREEAVQENDEERDTNIPMSILSSDTNDDVEGSRPISRHNPQLDGSVELPKITHSSQIHQLLRQIYQNNRHKSTSVISIKKYLQVKSKNQDTLEEEDDESVTNNPEDKSKEISAVDEMESNTDKHSSNHRPSNGIVTKKSTVNDKADNVDKMRGKDVEFEHPNATAMYNPLTQDNLLSLTNGEKQKLISNTAHALGVVSHDWARIPRKYRMARTQSSNHSEELGRERQAYTSPSRQSKPRSDSEMGYRNQITTPAPSSKGNFKTGTDISRAKTVHNDRPKDVQKIEKLKSIYDASHHHSRSKPAKSVHTSRQVSRCGSRHTSRPATRMQIQRTQHMHQQQAQVKGMQSSQSRPVTRTCYYNSRSSNNDGNLESLDESTYWNELPQAKASIFIAKGDATHGTGTTATFGIVGSHVNSSKKPSNPMFLQKSDWKEDLSRMVLKRDAAAAGGKKGADKIAQAISLAMKFHKPRESLMKKLTAGWGGGEGGGGVSKAVGVVGLKTDPHRKDKHS